MSAEFQDDHPRWTRDQLGEQSDFRIERELPRSLDAKEEDPYVSASTVAEYVFCPRAAIVTHEARFVDPEEEMPWLPLLSWYELDALKEKHRWWVYGLAAMPAILIVATVLLSVVAIGTTAFPLLLIGLLLGWLYGAIRVFLGWHEVHKALLAAEGATECDPDPNKQTSQPVDWWGLLKAGYDAREASLEDEQWRLGGKPRRVLDKGSMSIPVHRINKTAGPLRPQHIVRAMAHCHLVETSEGANSPFAVVLYGNTYKGTTVPNTRINREKFYTALKEVRELIRLADAGRSEPPAPVDGRKCSECPHGRPRSVSREKPAERYGDPLEPAVFVKGRRRVHCDCGDRFGWKPKHNQLKGFVRIE